MSAERTACGYQFHDPGKHCRNRASYVALMGDESEVPLCGTHLNAVSLRQGPRGLKAWLPIAEEWVSVAEPRLIVRRDGLVRIVIEPRSPGLPPTFAGEPINGPAALQTRSTTDASKEPHSA